MRLHQFPHRLSLIAPTDYPQCDLVQPSCSQCRRAKRNCPGYRDQLDLIFRDQSDVTANKVQQASPNVAKYPKHATPNWHKELARSVPLELVKNADAPAKPIHVPYVDQAASFFFKTYDSEAAESVKSVYRCIPYLYDAFQDSALSSVITALGLAGLSRYWNAPNMMSHATSNYYTALRQIRTDLQDPVAVKTDQTLLSVYLLGLYEVWKSSRDAGLLSADRMSDEHMQHPFIYESLVQSRQGSHCFVATSR